MLYYILLLYYIVLMKREQLQPSILIYPIKNSKTMRKSPEYCFKASKSLKNKSLEKDEYVSPNNFSHSNPINIEDKEVKAAHPLQLLKLQGLNSNTPILRKNLIDEFLNFVKSWDYQNTEVKSITQKEIKLKSSISEVLNSVRIFRKSSKLSSFKRL